MPKSQSAVMRVQVRYTESFSPEDLKAYCRYHGLDPTARRRLREHIFANLMNVGSMGVEEQVHEGYQRLEYETRGDADE